MWRERELQCEVARLHRGQIATVAPLQRPLAQPDGRIRLAGLGHAEAGARQALVVAEALACTSLTAACANSNWRGANCEPMPCACSTRLRKKVIWKPSFRAAPAPVRAWPVMYHHSMRLCGWLPWSRGQLSAAGLVFFAGAVGGPRPPPRTRLRHRALQASRHAGPPVDSGALRDEGGRGRKRDMRHCRGCQNRAMDLQHLLLARDGAITTVTLNRPEQRNALARR